MFIDCQQRVFPRLRRGGNNRHHAAVVGRHSRRGRRQIRRQYTEGFCDVRSYRHRLHSLGLLIRRHVVRAVYLRHCSRNAVHLPLCEICPTAHRRQVE